ncbi:MAG: BatA domain-containing protein [Planctomycetota bacterium]|nr:BatA domain-containing protein [Planctomycetota bacterium]
MTVLHPFLLAGLAAVAVPILIHLLLRERPRPLPWAAMRWLQAAQQRALRRWRLTNWLLLALRCLAVALLALAVARPALPGLGDGEQLVLIVDRSASMGPLHDDPGALAEAQARLAQAELPYARWTLIAVGAPGIVGSEGTELLASGSLATVREALSRLRALPLPGGLDGAALEAVSAALAPGCDVLLVSDFRQDEGRRLAAHCARVARRVARWAVGEPRPNRRFASAPLAPDLRSGEPGELRLALAGPAGPLRLGLGAAPPVRVAERASGELRLPLPALPAGQHRLQLQLDAGGLLYDDRLELALSVPPPLPALVVADRLDYAAAAVLASDGSVEPQRILPGAFPGTPLPSGGAVILRAPVPDAHRLASWVRGGGVLWAEARLLAADPALAALLSLRLDGAPRPGGPYRSGEPDLDETLAVASRAQVPSCSVPDAARVLLSAGEAPLVVALPVGLGWLAVELVPLASDADFIARPTVPLWVLRSLRALSGAAQQPLSLTAGAPAPRALQLVREGRHAALRAGEPVLLAPGTWEAEGRQALVLPDPEEGRTEVRASPEISRDLATALPQRPGRDLGWPLLLAAALVLAGELALARWAAQRYGASSG